MVLFNTFRPQRRAYKCFTRSESLLSVDTCTCRWLSVQEGSQFFKRWPLGYANNNYN